MKYFVACWTLAAVATLAACGGSTNSDHSVSYATFSDADSAAIYGDWQQQYYVVRDQQTWESIWATRRSALNCDTAYNATACNTASPPSVDFSTNTLVGIYLTGKVFLNPPLRITESGNEGLVSVEYRWGPFVCGFGCTRGPAVLFVKIATRNPDVEILATQE